MNSSSILYVTHELPWPPNNGHKRRTFDLVRGIAAHHRLVLLGYTEVDARQVEAELKLGIPGLVRVHALPLAIRLRRRPLALAGALAAALLECRPYSVAKFSTRACREIVAKYLADDPDRLCMATLPMIENVLSAGAKRVMLDEHDVMHRLWRDFLPVSAFWLRPFVRREAQLLEKLEKNVWSRAAAIMAICNEDAAQIAPFAQGPVVTVPVLVAPAEPEATVLPPRDVGMLGVWSWAPNGIALRHFAEQIWPRLASRNLTARISGPGLSSLMRRRLEARGIEVTGAIADVRSFYGSVRAVAAPFIIGGGVRMKVAEAIAHCVPVVGYPLAFRGLHAAGPAIRHIVEAPDAMVERLTAIVRDHPTERGRARGIREALLVAHRPVAFEAAIQGLLARLMLGSEVAA